jgi:hypothetical protein
MAQIAENSLEARFAELEAQVRSLTAGNWTDRASVTNAAGAAVPLSGLAFGQVAATKAGVGAVSIDGVTNSSGVTPWIYPGPEVEVLVTGGRLRVDWASLLALSGIAGNRMVMSYRVMYLGPQDQRGSVANVVVAPDYYRALIVSNGGNVAASGTFAFHEGLAPGWYRVTGAFQMYYGAQSGTPQGSADNPRLGATPY